MIFSLVSALANRSTSVEDPRTHHHDKIMAWLVPARKVLDELFIDPWFTSLWTLQEAFLCPQAYLVSREGITSGFTLHDLCAWCSTLQSACSNPVFTGEPSWARGKFTTHEPLQLRRKYQLQVEGMINHRGLSALGTHSPIALLGAASYRKSRNEMDRVYAIQQVFDLRLGTSAPGANYRGIPLLVLENDLGAGILALYPVLSQLHVFTEPVELGRGWRISGMSRVPDLGLTNNIAVIRHTPDCRLSTTIVARLQWGFFEGRACGFEEIRRAWARVDGLSGSSPQFIAPDMFLSPKKERYRDTPNDELTPEAFEAFEAKLSAVQEFSRDLPRGQKQHELAEWMSRRLGGDELHNQKLIVLLLGHFVDDLEGNNQWQSSLQRVGLILLESELEAVRYWRRLGFCIWTCPDRADVETSDEGKARELLAAPHDHEQWQRLTGLFG